MKTYPISDEDAARLRKWNGKAANHNDRSSNLSIANAATGDEFNPNNDSELNDALPYVGGKEVSHDGRAKHDYRLCSEVIKRVQSENKELKKENQKLRELLSDKIQSLIKSVVKP